MLRKNDEHDAYCVATVLINQLHTLPDAKPKDNEWTLAQFVNRRDSLVKDGIRFKRTKYLRNMVKKKFLNIIRYILMENTSMIQDIVNFLFLKRNTLICLIR